MLYIYNPKSGTGGLCTLFYFCVFPPMTLRLYATGLYNRIGEFIDVSPRAIEKFTHEGWDAFIYQDGQSASVAVGQSIQKNTKIYGSPSMAR